MKSEKFSEVSFQSIATNGWPLTSEYWLLNVRQSYDNSREKVKEKEGEK